MLKTYSRKRQENKLLVDVLDLCRLCLARSEETVPIFERADNVCAALPMRIMICLGYEITQEDCLPNAICINCHQELERYYKFRKKCEDSYLKLKSHFKATKCKDRINEVLSEQKIYDEEDKVNTCEPFKSTIELCGTTCVIYGNTVETNGSRKIQEDTQVDEIERLVIADVFNINEQEKATMANSSMPETDVNVEETTEVIHMGLLEDHVDKTGLCFKNFQIQFIEQNNEVNPDISTFLNAILVELGVLVKNDGGLVVQDQGVTSFELETGDDDQLVFELVEEDEVEEPPIAFVMPEPHSKYQEIAKSKLMKKGKKSCARKKVAVQKTGAWCGVCGRAFASCSAARRHGAVHSGARPHACPDCGRTFAQKVVMERHRLLHRERRPHQCGQCTKSFTQRGALETHARTHAPPQTRALTLHACAHCDRVFLYASGLSRHMMTHNGRMFACGTCDRLFNDRSSLLRHVRSAHPLDSARVAAPIKHTSDSPRPETNI